MKKFTLKSIIVFLCMWLLSPLCFAAVISPTVQLQQVADKMITQLENNKSQLHHMSVIRRIVNQVLIPHIDLDNMSAHVTGRAWQTASAAQRAQFKKEFAHMVTTTYAAALSSYHGDIVHVFPVRGGYDHQTVVVNSTITRPNGQRIPISYDVSRSGNQWKVYDFSIEHVSMVQSYRSQFSGVLAQGGMPALLARIQNHNRSGK